MKEKINAKTIIVLAVLIMVGVLSVLGVQTAKTYLSGAASGTEPKNVVGSPNADGKSAVVSWLSDKPSMGVVEYGTTPASLLLRAVETEAVTDHKVTLTPLKSGVNYYFRIRVGEDVFDNNGIPYTFKTNADAASTGEEVQPEVQPTSAPVMDGAVTPVPAQSAGVCNRTTDYNGDGVINSLDFMSCQKGNSSTETPTTMPIQSGTSIQTTTPAPATGQCQPGVDYNKDGTVNSLDIIKCRQGTP